MQKWEYESIILEASGFSERSPEPKGRATAKVMKYLNEVGANGWELVSATTVTSDGHYHMLYLKRPASLTPNG
jgi:hypothetical protein